MKSLKVLAALAIAAATFSACGNSTPKANLKTDVDSLSYAIGLAEPTSILVDTFGTAHVNDEVIQSMLKSYVDPRPAAIIQKFCLSAPRFSQVSCYGHFGANASEMPWECLDLADKLSAR